jgi:hypothetical protein
MKAVKGKGAKRRKGRRMALGLAISGALLKPGETRSQAELAAFCGCTRNAIWEIERRALRKLRHPDRARKLREELKY